MVAAQARKSAVQGAQYYDTQKGKINSDQKVSGDDPGNQDKNCN